MQTDLNDKIALVTGASGGLGSHFAKTLASVGAHVILAGRRLDAMNSLKEDIEAGGGKASRIALDVGDARSIADCVKDVSVTVGTINILVNNAGVTHQAPALDINEEDWDKVQAINLRGPMLLARSCAQRLIDEGVPGSIINISSILGHRVVGHVSPYIASKAGLEHLTRALALEWARYGIRVNSIAPGYVETDMNRAFFKTAAGEKVVKRIPQRRLGQASDLDGALLLLASDASAYMTGSNIVVDGGHSQAGL